MKRARWAESLADAIRKTLLKPAEEANLHAGV